MSKLLNSRSIMETIKNDLMWAVLFSPIIRLFLPTRPSRSLVRFAALTWALLVLRSALIWLSMHPEMPPWAKYTVYSPTDWQHQCSRYGIPYNDYIEFAIAYLARLGRDYVRLGGDVIFQAILDMGVEHSTGAHIHQLPWLPLLVISAMFSDLIENPFVKRQVAYIRGGIVERWIAKQGWTLMEPLRWPWAYFVAYQGFFTAL
ncbi:hypothetical protein F5Y16DRAFT_280080 [Xylariaceae sp. FL0255]|nr:hypothetical protein F5Y16DRAFT_280080 [Xylariaceae sp. FL0255]